MILHTLGVQVESKLRKGGLCGGCIGYRAKGLESLEGDDIGDYIGENYMGC